MGDARVIGLGPNGVQFAVDLLAKEIERAAHSIRAIQIFPEAPQMRAETGGLLGNVTALGKDCDFFEQSFIVEIQFKSRLTQALMEKFPLTGNDIAGGFADDFGVRGDDIETAKEITFQISSLEAAHFR